MKETTLLKLKQLLTNRRREILKQVAHLEAEQEELGEPSIEKIDEAQKEDLAWFAAKLDDRGKEEIREINRALEKMDTGSYGGCELCGNSIPFKRLEALPATRFCHKCARRFEETQRLRQHLPDEVVDEKRLEEYRDLDV